MKRVVFITPSDAEPGFRLAGVRQIVSGPETVRETVGAALRDEDNGLVVLDERLARTIPDEDLQALDRPRQAVLAVLPSPRAEAEPAEDPLAQLIRRTIGYHVRIAP